MRSLYLALVNAARRFFIATGIPVPGFARRVHRTLRGRFGRERRNLRDEVEALVRRVERLETTEYLDRIGRQSD